MARDITSNLPLQDMIARVVNGATQKLAEDEKAKKVKNLLAYEKNEHGHIPSVAEEKSEKSGKTEKTASARGPRVTREFAEKLASAVDYIAQNADSIVPAQRGVIEGAIAKLAGGMGVPPAVNVPGSVLKTTQAIGGEQAHPKDKPKTEDAAESEAKTPLHNAGRPGGATQVENNMNNAPGGGGKTPTGKYPENGVLQHLKKHASPSEFYAAALSMKAEQEKHAFAVTQKGHQFDSQLYEMLARHEAEKAQLVQQYGGLAAHGAPANWMDALRFGMNIGGETRPDDLARHYEYAAKQHAAGKNAWNPFGGTLTPSSHEQGGTPGLLGSYGKSVPQPAKAKHTSKTEKTAASEALQFIMSKLAGEDVFPANISAPKDASPLSGGGVLKNYESGEMPPTSAMPGHSESGAGNQARSLLESNDKAQHYTKGEAKAPVKPELKKLLDEPALNSKTDSILRKNLQNSDKAGVKIAEVQAAIFQQLQKVAAEGCTCGSKGDCSYCRLQEARKTLKTHKSEASSKTEKTAMFEAGGAGGGGYGGGAPTPPNPMGGGMPGKTGGTPPPDCTCGGQKQCDACKRQELMELLMQSKQQPQVAAEKGTGDMMGQMSGGMAPGGM